MQSQAQALSKAVAVFKVAQSGEAVSVRPDDGAATHSKGNGAGESLVRSERRSPNRAKNVERLPQKTEPKLEPKAQPEAKPQAGPTKTGTDDEWSEF
jgi:methyl-accepting chemotaxis protein/methyl-accepting chemotaxis protein-1 (serine sensor receptor)